MRFHMPVFLSIVCILFASTVCAAPLHHPHSILITPQQLHQWITEKKTGLIIAEVSWGGPKDYDAGHVPGAIHINTDEIEYDEFNARSSTPADKLGRSTTIEEDQAKGLSPDSTLPRNWWNIYPDTLLLPALAFMGIDVNSTVVLYGKDPTAAARLAWTLLYAGVEHVFLLNGGLHAWKTAGFDVSTESVTRNPVANFGAKTALHPEYLVDVPFVRQKIKSNAPDFVLMDIRTRDEFDGKTAPYSYIPTKGRVHNAVWGKSGKGPWTMEYYVDKDGVFKTPQEVEAMWKEQGIRGDRHTAFYCGTGWRSSMAFLYAYMLGWDTISNFDSGWYEWSMGSEAAQNPIDTFSSK
ncbi:sulfurtransferase [Desulfovibrio inopinatus]|uniref:sulfurtransferase n=1 Tax=Desulfovibrio inopinatus TaxID=102109 RepID=UPI0004190243|nr:rhodanese-like domain-containing protein [Desulfovibrio inopinatus]